MMIRCLLSAVVIFQVCLAIPLGLEPKVINGEDATPGEFPYLVSVRQCELDNKFYHICGGTILNKNYVMTAGHCVSKYGTFKVLAGKHYVSQIEAMQQEVKVEEIIIHEKYNRHITLHDIAILKLKTPLILNKVVSPIELPEQNEIRVGDAMLCGWGSISKRPDPEFPEILQKANLPVLDNQSCLKKLLNITRNNAHNLKLYDTQICSDAVRQMSACVGDSGSPLLQKENNITIQIGIVSWGMYPCGAPSVYTRVASYVNWINNIINA